MMSDRTQKEKDEAMTRKKGFKNKNVKKVNKIIKDRQDKDKPSNNKYNNAQKAYMESKKKKKGGFLSKVGRALGL
jgi:regulatory protein YycH of two-component signal transduction system YycFG